MNRILGFLRDKAFVLILLACIAVAAGTGIWAVTTVRSRLSDDLSNSGSTAAGQEDYPGADVEDELGGETPWDTEGQLGVAGKAENVPEGSSNSEAASSAGRSGSVLPSDAGAEPQEQPEPAAAPVPSYTQPVSGRVIAAFSGDDLVYNKTLGDWRTHNGTDYACDAGETVFAPVSGKVLAVQSGGNWGGVVELADADGVTWRVCGVQGSQLKAGDAVSVGQQLGTAEEVDSESLAGSHIHLELEKNGKYLDPAEYLG